MNTKHVEDTAERKKLKRTARKEAAPAVHRAPPARPRGSNKKKVKDQSRVSARSAKRVSLFRTKNIDVLIADSEAPGKRLAKSLGPWSLTALGIGAVIGSGIFILTGTAAAGETLAVPSILNAPILDLILHGGSPPSTIGTAGRGPGHFLVVPPCSSRLPVRRALLRRTCLDDSDRGKRVYVRLRDARRDLRLDHRLGSHPRVRRVQHGGGRRILGVFQRHPRRFVRSSIFQGSYPSR